MKRKIKLIINMFLLLSGVLWSENYSKQLQQAILLYEEGKNTDAMDRFMDILVSGTPQEKIIASEYISKITQGIPPNQKLQKSDTKIIIKDNDVKSNIKKDNTVLNQKENNLKADDAAEIISKKVNNKIKQMRNDTLVLLSKKNFLKFYMDSNNEKPNFILLKEDKIFNEDMTFKANIIEDLKNLAGLIDLLGKVVITIIPNGAVSGNMKIANVRKATTMHSYFTSYGLSPTKVKLDIAGNYPQSSLSKKIDDFDGIILVIDYDKEPELVVSDSNSPQVYMAVYPEKINPYKDEAAIVDFAVLMGKNPISSWKLVLSRKTKTSSYTIQKVEDTIPIHSQIVFNGREKFTGPFYEPGEYEFFLEVADIKGNTAQTKKTIYLLNAAEKTVSESKENENKKLNHSKLQKTSQTASSKDSTKTNQKSQKIFCKVYFKQNTFEITDLSMEGLEKCVSDIKKTPKAKIIITGYAYSKEPKPKTAAFKRANVVKNILVKKYKIKSSQIMMQQKVVNFKKTIAEIKVD